MFYILDEENRPVETDTITWGLFFERLENRCVGYTEITSECCVSTVFLGIDHRFSKRGPPILFETMVFGGPLDEEQWQYASWDDALVGHAAAVKKARKALGQRIDEEASAVNRD